MFVVVRKPEQPEETYADVRRACRLHTERPFGGPVVILL